MFAILNINNIGLVELAFRRTGSNSTWSVWLPERICVEMGHILQWYQCQKIQVFPKCEVSFRSITVQIGELQKLAQVQALKHSKCSLLAEVKTFNFMDPYCHTSLSLTCLMRLLHNWIWIFLGGPILTILKCSMLNLRHQNYVHQNLTNCGKLMKETACQLLTSTAGHPSLKHSSVWRKLHLLHFQVLTQLIHVNRFSVTWKLL